MAIPTMPDLECPDCGGKLVLQENLFRDGNDWIYMCESWPKCRGLCSAHPDGRPAGTPANAPTRRARRLTHAMFDRLWERAEIMACYDYVRDLPKDERDTAINNMRRAARSRAYSWLAETMDLTVKEARIGHLDIPALRDVYRFARKITPEAIRQWAKQRKKAA